MVLYIYIYIYIYQMIWVFLFNGISTFVGYLNGKAIFLQKRVVVQFDP